MVPEFPWLGAHAAPARVQIGGIEQHRPEYRAEVHAALGEPVRLAIVEDLAAHEDLDPAPSWWHWSDPGSRGRRQGRCVRVDT